MIDKTEMFATRRARAERIPHPVKLAPALDLAAARLDRTEARHANWRLYRGPQMAIALLENAIRTFDKSGPSPLIAKIANSAKGVR